MAGIIKVEGHHTWKLIIRKVLLFVFVRTSALLRLIFHPLRKWWRKSVNQNLADINQAQGQSKCSRRHRVGGLCVFSYFYQHFTSPGLGVLLPIRGLLERVLWYLCDFCRVQNIFCRVNKPIHKPSIEIGRTVWTTLTLGRICKAKNYDHSTTINL